MKYSLLSVLVLTISLLGALSGAPVAHAASDYDNMVVNTETIQIQDMMYAKCGPQDLTTTWSQYIENDQYTNGASNWFDMKLSFQRAKELGSWAVIQDKTDYGNGRIIDQIIVYWSEDSATVSFKTDENGGKYADFDATQVHRVAIANHGYVNGGADCTPVAWSYNANTAQYERKVAGDGIYYVKYPVFLISDANMVYPTGYEGENFNTGGADSGPIQSAEIPEVEMISMANFEGVFADKRFYTFDEVPFTCQDGFPPRMTMELWDKTGTEGVELFEETVSANSELRYKFPEAGMTKNYEIVAWYSCTDGATEFNGSQFYTFSINKSGTLVNEAILEQCLTETFPYIQASGCIANLQTAAGLMSFGSLKLGTSFEFTEACHEMGTLGTWLNLEERTVCPAISSEVRNIVTPFITFALGLMVMKFITSKAGSMV